MTLVLVVWAMDKVMLDGFDCESLAMWAGGGLGFADTEKVLVKRGMACLKLCDNSRLVAI